MFEMKEYQIREDAEISKTILEAMAAAELCPVLTDQEDIRINSAVENYENLSITNRVLHMEVLKKAGLMEVEFYDYLSPDDTLRHVTDPIGLTEQGRDCVKCIRSPFWDKALKQLKRVEKPETIQLLFSVCKKLIQQS